MESLLASLLHVVSDNEGISCPDMKDFLEANPKHLQEFSSLTNTPLGLLRFVRFVKVLGDQCISDLDGSIVIGAVMAQLRSKQQEVIQKVQPSDDAKMLPDLTASMEHFAGFNIVDDAFCASGLCMMLCKFSKDMVSKKSLKIRGKHPMQALAHYFQFLSDLNDVNDKLVKLYKDNK